MFLEIILDTFSRFLRSKSCLFWLYLNTRRKTHGLKSVGGCVLPILSVLVLGEVCYDLIL